MDRRGRRSHILVHRSAATRDRGLVPRSLGEGGFTLVEVLVALVLLLIGAYATLRVFPAGFAAIERSRYESIAARLADQEIQRWRLAAGSLPEAIVWGDSSSGSLIYRTDYDPNSLVPNPANPNWQADSAYLPRTIIGEMMPVGDIEAGGAVAVPLCRLRYGPLEHLYDNPGAADYPLFIYTSQYERVDRVGFLLDSAAPAPKDWGRYYINYDQGTISFDKADYERRYRVEFTYLTATGQGEERQVEMTDTTQLITVPAGWDTTPTGTALGQGPLSLWPAQTIAAAPGGAVRDAAGTTVTITTEAPHGFTIGQKVIIAGVTPSSFNGTFGPITVPPGPNPTTFDYAQAGTSGQTGGGGTAGPLPADFAGVVPLSERVHQAFIHDTYDPTAGPWTPVPGHFALDRHVAGASYALDDIGAPDAHLLFHPGDAGRTVNVDYRVRDWQILAEERMLDAGMLIKLSISPVKSPTYTNPPRQPGAPDRLVPGDDDMVIVIDTEDGSRLDNSKLDVNYDTGVIANKPGAVPPQLAAGHTYRIYYRGEMDWTVQPMKAAANYAVMVGVGVTPGYRSAVWSEGTNELGFGRSEVGKSVVATYHYQAAGDPTLVSGELHQVQWDENRGVAFVSLDNTPIKENGIRVHGTSVRSRVLWAGRGTTTAVNGELSPERWQHVAVDSFLRR